jgi:hypothetical protein
MKNNPVSQDFYKEIVSGRLFILIREGQPGSKQSILLTALTQ